MKIYRVKKPLQDNSTLDNVEMFDNLRYNWDNYYLIEKFILLC